MGQTERLPPAFRQKGAALLLFVLIGLVIGIGLVFSLVPSSGRVERNSISEAALAQAKSALIGYAITYRETHPNAVTHEFDQSFGYLPCPDTDNDGVAEVNCGATDVAVVGRLPWKTLGLPALRDGDNECLWYAVSGRAKNNPKTAIYNWDTTGQFVIQDATGNSVAGATPHEQPLAAILAAGSVVGSQARAGGGATECGGNNNVADYLEGVGALGTGNTTIALATADSIKNGTNNDRAQWITAAEIFGPIKKRADFKTDVDTMLSDLKIYLDGLPPAALPAATGSKGMATVAANYLGTVLPARKANFFSNWQDNLLYAKPGSPSIVNGETNCHAVLLFAGERLTPGQPRSTTAERDTPANYLEAPLAALFPAQGSYTGNIDYFSNNSSADLVRCIKGLTPPAAQASFATDFGAFTASGAAAAVAPDAAAQALTLLDASGSTGGCFWYENAVPLAGRTLRSYYTFQFDFADPAGGLDLGNGFTLQLTRGDLGLPLGCGNETNNGALGPTATGAAPGTWGSFSFIIETDIRRNASRNDPAGNHTAIMKNGSVDHAGFGSLSSSACNGTSNLCEHAATDKFEESPTPSAHNQRLEIFTGCNSTCAICTPSSHVAPNTYAKVSVWVDCVNCSDVTTNLDRSVQAPTVQICSNLDASMNAVFFGLTGGFRSGPSNNRVTVRNFVLRSE